MVNAGAPQLQFRIRVATMGDAPEILACLRAAFEAYRTNYTPDAFTDTVLAPDSIHQRFSTMSIFVAVADDGRIVGTIACALVGSGEGHLRGMAVLPEWQGMGIAEELLQQAETELVSRNCSRITLDTTEPLQRAMRFYEKHGYRRSGRVSDFYGMRLHEYLKALNLEYL